LAHDEIVREAPGGTERLTGEELGLVVTDRRVLILARGQTGREVIVATYAQIDTTAVREGSFETRLRIVLGDGEHYRLTPVTSDPLTRITGYIDVASECVDEVDHALDRARDGAESTLADAGIDPGRSAEIEETRRACAIIAVEARLDRAASLAAGAGDKADRRAYTDAYRTYLDAREHLERSLALDIRYDLGMGARIQDRLDTRIEALSLRPLGVAKQARERAVHADSLRGAIDAWEQAFEAYRDLLTAGWGASFEFAGDESDTRFQIECAVDSLVECRHRYALYLTAAGDHHRNADEPDDARDCYGRALTTLEEARRLARQYRAGDTDRLRETRAETAARLPVKPDV